jgi:hypothetical protein
VARAELRAAREAIRRELSVLAVVMGVFTLLLVVFSVQGAFTEPLALGDMTLPLILLALLAPVGMWKGELPTPAYRWSMPLDRPRHTLLKVLAGWAWLMAFVAGYLLWVVALNAFAEGEVHVGVEWAHVMTRRQLPPGVPMVDMVVADHRWIWRVPFTSATLCYLIGSAVVLASRRPWRWLAGTVFGWVVVGQFVAAARAEWLGNALSAVVAGRYGLVSALTGVPGLGAWAGATLLWTALAAAGVLAAAYRYRDA